jgi:hypothetical protein
MKTHVLDRVARLEKEPADLPAEVERRLSGPVSAATAFERNLADFDNDPPWPGEWDNASR